MINSGQSPNPCATNTKLPPLLVVITPNPLYDPQLIVKRKKQDKTHLLPIMDKITKPKQFDN